MDLFAYYLLIGMALALSSIPTWIRLFSSPKKVEEWRSIMAGCNNLPGIWRPLAGLVGALITLATLAMFCLAWPVVLVNRIRRYLNNDPL